MKRHSDEVRITVKLPGGSSIDIVCGVAIVWTLLAGLVAWATLLFA